MPWAGRGGFDQNLQGRREVGRFHRDSPYGSATDLRFVGDLNVATPANVAHDLHPAQCARPITSASAASPFKARSQCRGADADRLVDPMTSGAPTNGTDGEPLDNRARDPDGADRRPHHEPRSWPTRGLSGLSANPQISPSTSSLDIVSLNHARRRYPPHPKGVASGSRSTSERLSLCCAPSSSTATGASRGWAIKKSVLR